MNRFQLNESKCKELRISFSKTPPDLDAVMINDKPIEVVTSVKLLGLNITNDLKWNTHLSEITRKVSSRLYFLRQLKRARVDSNELLTFYMTCIRPVAEYACPVFHNSLPKYLSDELENLQKRAFRIIYPNATYNEALAISSLPKMNERRSTITQALFEKIMSNTDHNLYNLLPPRNDSNRQLRKTRTFSKPVTRTNRLRNTFIYSNCNQ